VDRNTNTAKRRLILITRIDVLRRPNAGRIEKTDEGPH
jgi:hypothetical protein